MLKADSELALLQQAPASNAAPATNVARALQAAAHLHTLLQVRPMDA
jgi:hypothetical protein